MAKSASVVVCVAVAVLAVAGMAWAAGCGCPTIKNLSPAADSTTSDVTPEIAATVKDRQTNLAKKHIKLFVDGVRTTTFSYDRAADRLSHTPAAALTDGGHTVKIVARDNAGKVGRKAWRFSVGTPPDTTAPTIDTVSPTNEATGVAPQTDVAVTFSEAMDPSTLSTSTFTLVKQDSSAPVMATVSYDPATKEVTLDPAAALASTTTYTAVIKGGSGGAKDLAGNALAQDHSWTFTTATAQPTVVSHAPQSMGGPSTNVTATFSVDMDSSTLTPSTFTLTRQGSSVPLAAQVTYDSASKTASLNPDSDLSDSTSYTALIKGGAGGAKDQAGNALAQDHSWTFMVCSGGIILSSPDTIVPRGVVVCG